MAAQAATVAALLAARLDEPLILLYALDELADFRVDPEAARACESVFDLAKQRLPAEAERLRGYGANVEEVFVTGAADESLVSRADNSGAQLIVLASTGRRGVSRWLLGSVAERTLRSSSVPVLVIRAAAPLEAWVRGERPLRVMVGTDLSAVSELAIRWTAALRQIGPCRITVVHAAGAYADEARALERDLRLRIQEISDDAADIRVIVHSMTGPAGRYLARLAATEQVDLLVVGSRQRTGLDRFWHGTVAGEALFLARTNVACVPALAPEERRAEPIPEVRTILAATDFSKLGNAAVLYAYSLVASGGVVHLVHVLQPPPFQSTLSPSSSDLAFTLETASEHDLAARLASLVPNDADTRDLVAVDHCREPGCRRRHSWRGHPIERGRNLHGDSWSFVAGGSCRRVGRPGSGESHSATAATDSSASRHLTLPVLRNKTAVRLLIGRVFWGILESGAKDFPPRIFRPASSLNPRADHTRL
jgi:nucleotide-binding universal stress UspA family protein